MTEPEFDADGYPTDRTLEAIERWQIRSNDDIAGLLEFCERAFHKVYGRVMITDEGVKFATGGWSGNESVIKAMQKNPAFWMLCWQSSQRGGRHVFQLKPLSEKK